MVTAVDITGFVTFTDLERKGRTEINGGNITTYDGLSDITKGARSLIINFNKEIVSMPISIDNVNDGADLGAQIQGALYDNIMRGLQVALNNATGAM